MHLTQSLMVLKYTTDCSIWELPKGDQMERSHLGFFFCRLEEGLQQDERQLLIDPSFAHSSLVKVECIILFTPVILTCGKWIH